MLSSFTAVYVTHFPKDNRWIKLLGTSSVMLRVQINYDGEYSLGCLRLRGRLHPFHRHRCLEQLWQKLG